jgi:hypothetical protein
MYKRCTKDVYATCIYIGKCSNYNKYTTNAQLQGTLEGSPPMCLGVVHLQCTCCACIIAYIYIYIYIYEKSKKIISYLHRIFIDFGWWVGSFYKEIPWGSGTQISNKKITWKIITDFPLIGNPNQIGNDAGIQL